MDGCKILVNKNNKITPFFKEDAVEVAFVSDTFFVDFLGVAINSVIANASQSRQYDIIIITTNILDMQIQELLMLKRGKENISIRFAYVNQFAETLSFMPVGNYNAFTYYRLLLPYIVDRIEKIVYLDADLIINSDISELYDMDMEGNIVLGTYDVQITSWQNYDSEMRTYFNAVGLKESGKYVQAGVLLFNLKRMVEYCKLDTILKQACTERFVFNDQDIINICFKEKIKIVSLEWNVLNLSENGMRNCETYLTTQQRQEHENSRKNPKIIHYVEKSFPCFRFESPFADIYWKYAKGTPFEKNILNRRKDYEKTTSKEAVEQKQWLKVRCFRLVKGKKLFSTILRKAKGIIAGRAIYEIDLREAVVEGDYLIVGRKICIKPGAELSCLHCVMERGRRDIVVVMENSGKEIKDVLCAVTAGCRHIQLTQSKLQKERNRIVCELSEKYYDVEIILKNNSNSNVIVKKIKLETY
jgi:Lipopolysaccharide biosynthesis proteins, LPS:glycosyltransferases